MSDSVVGERRRAERRSIPDRRTADDRRLVGERRCGQRRVVDTPVAVERRSGIDRRFRVLSTSSVRDHVVVHALRRLIGRLYQLAKSRHRSEKAEGRLAEARSEILKLDPNLYLVAKTMDELKGSAITSVEEYEQAQEMLLRFKPRNSEVQPAKRASKSRNGTRKGTRRSEATTSGRRATAKKATRKTATNKRTTKKRVAKTMDELKGSSIAKVEEHGRSTAKQATRKTAAKKRTTKKTVAKTKSSARRTRP